MVRDIVSETGSGSNGVRRFAVIGAWMGLIGVAAGAFGAHALRQRLDPVHRQVFETAVRYQMLHALALLALGLAREAGRIRFIRAAGWLFASGIVLFSGSLYGLALDAPTWIGAVTPLGGLALIIGWLVLTIGLSRS